MSRTQRTVSRRNQTGARRTSMNSLKMTNILSKATTITLEVTTTFALNFPCWSTEWSTHKYASVTTDSMNHATADLFRIKIFTIHLTT